MLGSCDSWNRPGHMNWFRFHKRFAARLALFALFLQLALSFGHIHRGDFILARAGATAVTTANGQLPTGPDGAAGDVCPICALTQLVNVSVTAAPPSLPLPAVTVSSRLQAAIDIEIAAPSRGIFRARAPPQA
jgi:Protein of unknown function (DUF2946)